MTEVKFDGEETAFIVAAKAPIQDAQDRMTEIVENWEHYNYSVDRVAVLTE
ncbi:MAG: hypothetical protein K9N46_09195 [Candidatus Marinimicrobia bacterium]|nr:hypothetical protein [Candidatus Neomarinimicrobiota bacterium]MCF7829414.1 hypothetical protein [Candidatus Neomarinimicrobiota bacterium]MCF7880900.1 hypothetical protein [Candidatus Neomarinimicrobiota bacterium]